MIYEDDEQIKQNLVRNAEPPLPEEAPPVGSPNDPENAKARNAFDLTSAYTSIEDAAQESYRMMQREAITDYNAVSDAIANRVGELLKNPDVDPRSYETIKRNAALMQYRYYEKYQNAAETNERTLRGRTFDARADDYVQKALENPAEAAAYKGQIGQLAQGLIDMKFDPYLVIQKLRGAHQQIDAAALKSTSESNPFAAQKYFDANKEEYAAAYGDEFTSRWQDRISTMQSSTVRRLMEAAKSAPKALARGQQIDLPDLSIFKGTEAEGLAQQLENDFTAYNKINEASFRAIQSMADRGTPQAVERLKALKEDALGVLTNTGMLEQLPPINYKNPNSLVARLDAVKLAEDKFGAELPFFRKEEIQKLSALFTEKKSVEVVGIVSELGKNLRPQDRSRFANQMRSLSSDGKSELAYLGLYNPQIAALASKYDAIDPETKKNYADSDLKAALEESGLQPTKGSVEAVRVYLASNGEKPKYAKDAIAELYGAVDHDTFGPVATQIPGTAKKFEEVLDSIANDEAAFRKRLNGNPKYAGGEDFSLEDGDVRLIPTSTPGKFYVTRNEAFLGTDKGKKLVLNLKDDLDDFIR